MKILVTALTALLTFAGAGVATAADDPFYVAIGDSRAIGPTPSGGLTGDGCGRTDTAYPVKVAATLGVTYRSVACNGATADNMLHGQMASFIHPVPPQVDALSRNTKLVTLSIGGNDIGWAGLIAPCFLSPFGGDSRCRDNTGMQASIDRELAGLAPKVDRVLAEINRRSPDARVVVVGHGGFFGDRGCTPDATMSTADAPTVAKFFADFNGVLRASADRADADFVDITGLAKGHDACAGAQRWFVGNWPRGTAPMRHPTPLGSAGMAAAVVDALRWSVGGDVDRSGAD